MRRTSPVAVFWAVLAGLYFVVWVPVRADQIWFERLESPVHWTVALVSLPLGLLWCVWAACSVRRANSAVCFFLSVLYVVWWQLSLVAADWMLWDVLRANLARYGTVGLFLVGLGWVVWFVDRAAQPLEAKRTARRLQARTAELAAAPLADGAAAGPMVEPTWNPLDPGAWYYGRRFGKLNQSMAALVSYSLFFLLALVLLSQIQGCEEIYDLPAGGGEQKTIAQTVKVQRIIRKKFVVNPYSAILFEVPPIDDVKLNLNEATEHAYTIGYGEGSGAGFGGGTARGKVRFIRLEYEGGDWDRNFGIGGDQNMLIEYGIRTNHRVADNTESRRIAQLKSFPPNKSPPLVFMTGQKNISLSNSELKILRDYLLRKHGMIFADNCGSRHFHNQFLSMMNRVLPDVRPVPIPLDDVIHRVPYQIPFLPYVAPHGGKEALGWWKDGRWVCYYHPGDIGDAWRDDNSGVRAEIWEACYQLGTNVLFYAHAEYSKWLEAQEKNR
jgi:hypothetical protein